MKFECKPVTASFCTNSNVWLDFVLSNPKACPYPNNFGCDNCGYHKDKPVTAYYIRRKNILRWFK